MFQALRPDTGSFNRLLVWTGFALIVASFLLPWLFVRETGVLRVSEAELRSLTPGARQTVLDRQDLIEEAQGRYWWAFFLLPAGVLLVGIGGWGMRQQQKVEDTHLQAVVTKAQQDVTVSPQSREEKQEILREDVGGEPAGAGDPEAPPPRADDDVRRARMADQRERMQAREAMQQAILERLILLVPPGYSLQPQVKVSRQNATLLVDALFLANEPTHDDIVVEISFGSVVPLLRQSVERALARNLMYERIAGRSAWTWLIVVTPPGVDKSDVEERTRRWATAELFKDVVHITVVTSPDEIEAVPAKGSSGIAKQSRAS